MENNLELVSIVIPSYNHGVFIENCLNSILSDNYPNVQVDIIDDGSTDDSVQKIQNWKIRNPTIDIRLIVRENRGLNNTLNELIKNANGEYVCVLASDDALYFGGISKRVELLKKHPLKLAVIGDAKVIDLNGKIIYESAIEDLYNGNKFNYTSDDKLRYSIINEFSVPGPVLLVNKKLYEVIGPYPKLFAEDIYFYLRVIGMGLLIFLDEPVAYYRKHENNTGGNSKFSKELNKTFIISYLRNMKYYKGRLKFQLIKKLLGRVVVGISSNLRNSIENKFYGKS